MKPIAVLLVLLPLAACSKAPRDAVPDETTAIATAAKLCHWEMSDHLHAKPDGDRWRVWDDRGGAQAVVNRKGDGQTYLCIGL
jgi:uncharacterized lipoprotein